VNKASHGLGSEEVETPTLLHTISIVGHERPLWPSLSSIKSEVLNCSFFSLDLQQVSAESHPFPPLILWNEFKARFRAHYVPRGTMKLKKKEFAELKQSSMTVNEYLNSFIQLSRYALDDINTDEKKQDMFLNRLNDDIQFQLLNMDYTDFQHMVDKAIVIENKIKETGKDGKRKVPFHG
jgi:hypothetical protein